MRNMTIIDLLKLCIGIAIVGGFFTVLYFAAHVPDGFSDSRELEKKIIELSR